MSDDDLLAEQREFYRARAPEYDEWWQRRGRYDRGDEMAREWDAQVAELEAALAAFDPAGDVLELAGGTGWWTARLARTASRLTVVDAAPETLALNRKRVDRDDVEYVVADLFSWQPERQYDVVFFSFWLSHVPRNRVASFWGTVRACLKPDGRVFLIDNRHDPTLGTQDPYVLEYRSDEHLREVGDGRRFRVVKVMYEPDELAAGLAELGWDADIKQTRWFVYGSAVPR
jgi:demethylmenaquinone methyltransferase/2-methoxy-6-polyprenyl-1,4-benzoquinol methylase